MHAKGVEARFAALDRFLTEHQGLWRPRPFTHLHLPWETQHPELAQWLRQRSLADAESAHNHPHDLPAPAPFPQLAAQARQLSAVDKLPSLPLAPARHRLNVDVPGRKWQQIEAFGAALTFKHTPTHWLDWCAGKGHLGRRLLQTGQHLTCLEYDPALIAAGQALSDHHGLPVTHCQQDVMANVALSPDHTPVALHACGDLHVRLLQLANAVGCKHLAVAPCCYNRINADTYQPLSNAGRASTLQLSVDDLGLPLSETVTAGNRVRLQRDTSMARRLGFDQLQRQLRGCDEYLPTPSLPAGWLDKPFADYCRELASRKGLSTGQENWEALEAYGWRRLAEVRNLELVRGLFRRPLELWLVLDRALFLTENGYRVEVGSFCDATLTPRNLMVLAERD
ncbi:methyltransferase [Pseudomonas sp. P115]|uniref:methyltransferase n=1 Tax=Pseudomonas pisciculturae TaxID=2730413 RepID=UPI001357FAE6|nr:methyltransferase [Pseudomonas pisciculturae]MBF6028277.1 methyltransferase [Pseudomonas pisciculturae]